jgi:hypothetical protein
MLVIHRPGQPDEIISASAFRRRARQIEQDDADLGQTERGSSKGGPTPGAKAPAAQYIQPVAATATTLRVPGSAQD